MNEQEKHTDSQEEQKRKIRARYMGIDRDELEFIPAKPKEKLFESEAQKRVCAYCRVSTDDAKQTSSYELQKNHYEDMIKEHPGWTLVGIYADEGISGTSLQHRDDFIRMMNDCKAGKIDLVITKSVSRFARNIVDCIEKVRELAGLPSPVGVFFETEHIDTLNSTSEMMLAVLSATAQEESHTKSEIMNISIEQRFSRGIFLTPKLLGYDQDSDGNLVINQEEADTVKLCFYLFLGGSSTSEIAEILMDLGRKTKLGNRKWTGSSVVSVLQNERHCGDILSRKTFTPNYLNHKSKKNRKDRNQYRQKDHHEAIVSREVFAATQKMLAAYKYRKKGYPLPILQVVDGGTLNGFVPVNRTWTGFSASDYTQASQSAYDEAVKEIDNTQKQDSHFDLSGFEIVRSQFFSTRCNPAITISNGQLNFNTACLKKFKNVEYVELLLNSVEHGIAVRPCEKDNPNAIKWGKLKDGKWFVLPKSCKGFAAPLYEIMGWEKSCKYRFRGQYQTNGNEQVLIFNLEEPEIIKSEDIVCEEAETQTEDIENSENTDKIKKIRKKKIVYPANWVSGFGNKIESGEPLILQRFKYDGNWDVLRPAKMVEGVQIFNKETIDALMNEAEQMIDGMRDVI
ncbi:MAG: recombinase family protein [Clostridia bacterium]|nr:recombinase family protein [Anaerostipes sp.]NCC01574.1 recombinase family protein [Clostridia bacterium]